MAAVGQRLRGGALPVSLKSGTCARCRRMGPGRSYTFHYARLIDFKTEHESFGGLTRYTWTYANFGTDSAFICSRCVLSPLPILLLMLAAIVLLVTVAPAAMIAALLANLIKGSPDPAWGEYLAISISLLLLVVGMDWFLYKVWRPRLEHPERFETHLWAHQRRGERMAVKARQREIIHMHPVTTFWRADQFADLDWISPTEMRSLKRK